MPAILTNNLSVINAENFVDSFINGKSDIFMGVSRGWESGDTAPPANTSVSDVNKWTDEMNPPVPVDSIENQRSFRTNILGIKKIMVNDILIMVPRVNWIRGKIFNIKNEQVRYGVRATDYYCLTSNNEVWECVKIPHTASNHTKGSYLEPVLPESGSSLNEWEKSDTETIKVYVDYPEGAVESSDYKEAFLWRYLYTIPTSIANKKLLENWMPVMFNKHGKFSGGTGGTLQEEQYSFGDVNANRTLGAYRVMVSCTLKDESTIIPYDAVYRQVGLIVDPLSKPNNDGIQTKLTSQLYNEDSFDIMSGELVYIENKKAVHREQNQEETLNLILVF